MGGLHREGEALLSVVHGFISQLFISCSSVVTDKSSDSHDSLGVLLCLSQSNSWRRRGGRCRFEPDLLLIPALTVPGLRLEISTVGGRLYGHNHTTSTNSLVLYCLVQQHMAALLQLPVWGVFKVPVRYRATSLNICIAESPCFEFLWGPFKTHWGMLRFGLQASMLTWNTLVLRVLRLGHCHFKRCSMEHALKI